MPVLIHNTCLLCVPSCRCCCLPLPQHWHESRTAGLSTWYREALEQAPCHRATPGAHPCWRVQRGQDSRAPWRGGGSATGGMKLETAHGNAGEKLCHAYGPLERARPWRRRDPLRRCRTPSAAGRVAALGRAVVEAGVHGRPLQGRATPLRVREPFSLREEPPRHHDERCSPERAWAEVTQRASGTTRTGAHRSAYARAQPSGVSRCRTRKHYEAFKRALRLGVDGNELPRSKLRGINPKTPKPQNSCNWTSWRCNGLSVCAWPCFLTDWRRAASWPCRPTGLIQSPVDHKAPPHNGFLTAGTR